MENVGSDLEDKLLESLNLFDSQVEAVESLERQLAGAKAAVAESQAALLAIRKLVESPETKAALAAKPYDAELATVLGKLQKTANGGKATGAIPWAQLRSKGATDAQLRKNAEAVQGRFSGISIVMGKSPSILIRGENSNVVIKSGAADVLATVRRVMRVPLPVKESSGKSSPKGNKKSTAKKKAGKKNAARKPASKKKSAAPPKSAADKKLAPESESDPGGQGDRPS